MRPYWAVLAASALIAGAAAAQPTAPGSRPAPPAAADAAPLRALESDTTSSCFKDLALPALAQRVAALRAAGYDDAAFYRSAPETMLALALLYRQGGDFASADAIYRAMMAVASADDRRAAGGRSTTQEEQALLAHGATRPEERALLADLRDAPGEGGPYRLAQWVKPDCQASAPYGGRSALVLYRQDGATMTTVGSPVRADGRWDGFGDVCRACSPGVPVVLAWRNGRFEQACREVPDFYRQRLSELRQGLADRDPQYRFGAITSRLLARIQIGEAEQAWPEYRQALAALRRVRGSPRNAFSTAENQLAAALRAARPQLASAACPVNALTMR